MLLLCIYKWVNKQKYHLFILTVMNARVISSLVIVLLLSMAACQKDQDINPSVPVPQNGNVGNPYPGDSGDVPLKISSSAIMSASSPSQIPKQMFAVNPMYKSAYYHYKQPDLVSCSWTSYVNCINCIVTANNNYCYGTPISIVRYRCQQYYPNVQTYGANHILALEWHLATYDTDKVNYSRRSTTNRWEATRRMLAHINSYHTPFVVRSSTGSTGHYLVAFSIDWKQSETASTVYYTDCSYANAGSFNANIRSMSLYSFLNKMTAAGATCYNMLFMWP